MSNAETILSRSVAKAPPQKKGAKPGPFFNPLIQPKLTINQPNDAYEQEADAVADKVMRMTDHEVLQAKPSPVTIQKKCAECEEEEKLQKKEEGDEEERIQMRPAAASSLQRKCAECEEEEKLQRKCAACEEEDFQRKATSHQSAPAATPAVHQAIRSSGNPLDAGTRSFMEDRFHYDFGGVQVHNDPLAHRSAKEINARAYTHGQHIIFGAGQYQPNTRSGKELLAHELTHVVQQHSAGKSIQRSPQKSNSQTNFNGGGNVIDLHGRTQFNLGHDFDSYISFYLSQGLNEFPLTVAFGSMGQGTIYVKPKLLAFTRGCETDVVYESIILPIVIIQEDCGFYFDSTKTRFDVSPQLIPVDLPGLDTSSKSGTLALKVEIRNNVIISNEVNADDSNRALAWVAGKTKSTLNRSDYGKADFSREAFLPFIYGKDYDGKNFSGAMYTNHISDGYFIFNSAGSLALPNQQKIYGIIQLGDYRRWWLHSFDTDIVGANDYEFPVTRTDKGEISGEGEGLVFDETWTGKGFKAKGAVRASFVNSNLQIEGLASFESKRARGDLMVIVTDYTTAKRFATDYLPEDIAAKSKTDPPPNPTDRLAFAGAGNISFTLFDGNKESRKKIPDPKTAIGTAPKPQPNKALNAEASFVVEPEGYITIAGQVRTKEKDFTLFPATVPPYKKTIPVLEFTIFSIPGPLGTSANLVFSVDLSYGASIGPLTLSEIIADGRYSSRPDTASELELSALMKMMGKLFVELKACFEVKGSLLGVFDVDVLEYCPLILQLAAIGAIQARPTIQVVSPEKDPDRSTPPEYYIRGAFNFDVAGELALQISDSLTINLTKKEPKDPKDEKDKDVPKDWKYKRNKKTIKNRYGSKDVEIPMDHTLGSEEIPRVTLKNFLKDNLEERIKKLITQDRPKQRKYTKEYFEEGTASVPPKSKTPDENIKHGGYEEQGEERGQIDEGVVHAPAEEPSFVFEEKFSMNGQDHKLSLFVTQVNKTGGIDFNVVIMMESELEEIGEKIEEEKQDVKAHPDDVSAFKNKDIARIEADVERIKTDARKLGINNELANAPRYPALKQLGSSIQNYGSRYKKVDLGVPDQTVKPKCDEPKDAGKGMEITFTKYQGHENKGRVIGVASYVSPDRKSAEWTIQYRPYGSREGTMAAPPAYDKDCKPLYFITKPQNCEDVKTDHRLRYVLERNINGGRIAERTKASWVKAWPLCWGPYQEPIDRLVGQDRIKESRQGKWHRAHLIHGNMGGPGLVWNLIPVPKHINNDYLPDQYEKTLKDLVQTGFGAGKRYWFEAKVIYQDEYHPVIGHYNDFVKGIAVKFGEVQKDDKGEWKKFLPALTDMTLDFGTIPLRDELSPDRVRG